MEKMIVGSTRRYIAARNAMQTVYWRKTKDVEQNGFVKYNKNCNFGKNEPSAPSNVNKFTDVRNRYQ